MKFREHRGELSESMATAVDLPNAADALARHIGGLGLPGIGEVTADRLELEPYGETDARIGWHNVRLVNVMGWGPVGFLGEVE